MLQFHKSQDNPYITELYETALGNVGGHKAHELLHTCYKNHKRIDNETITLTRPQQKKTSVQVCFGTSCFLTGAQGVFKALLDMISREDLPASVDVKASFCFEACSRGPVVKIGGRVIEKCTPEMACRELKEELGAKKGA